MKKPFYLVGLAALALVGCSDNDFFSGGPEGSFGQASKGQLAFGISDGSGKTTRGEITGETAAKKLGEHFTVYGWKYVNNNSDATVGFEDVFQDYVVKWEGIGSAGTTESNTRGWEYVGYQSEPVNGSTPYDQTIKYWDWSTDRYDFIAWSIANGNAQVLTRAVVPGESKPDKNEPGLTFFAPTAKDLGGIFVSDKFTSVPKNEASHVIDDATLWSGNFEGLANVNIHPDRDNHRGLYSQAGSTNVTASGEPGIVNLQFRNLAAKVRIGLYETIPGYKVSDVVFYNATEAASNTGYISSGNKGYSLKWDDNTAGNNTDYAANQLFATLYADAETFIRKGNVSVKYHDALYNASDEEKDNVAYTAISDVTKAKYFAFGKLTNERGTVNPIASNPIGTTSPTASMSIGNDKDNLYTYVFPMEENANVLKLKVNYLLTSVDGSGEQIRVTGANAVVPLEFSKWRSNYAYTYLFKISDNTNGNTGGAGVDPAGLYPITFDACVVNTEDGMQQTITTVNDKSITTYQNGQQVTENSEYRKADADATTKTDRIYFTVEGNEGTNSLLTLNTTAGATQNVWLYTAWAADPSIITEEAVANYKANDIVLTDVTSKLDITETEAPNKSGAQYSIKFTSGTAASFEPIAEYYVVKAQYTDGGNTYLSYKVIKVQDGSEAKSYTISSIANITNIGSATFTITNSASGSEGSVAGAAGAIKVTTGTAPIKDVTNNFSITEGSNYTYTIQPRAGGVPAGTYIVNMGDADQNFTVTAPSWYNADASSKITSVNIEDGHEITVVIEDKDNGTPMEDVVPTITAGSNANGKLTATTSGTDGKITLTAADGAYGTFTVSHNGASFTVEVDNYTITANRIIINAGDADHNNAVLTLNNKNNSTNAGSVKGQVFTSSNTTAAASATAASDANTVTITALAAGKTTYSYKDAKCEIEVVNYVLTNNEGATIDGVKTIKLTKDGEDLSGAKFDVTTGVTVAPTSTAGVYKVTGSGTISYKYKNVVVADITM